MTCAIEIDSAGRCASIAEDGCAKTQRQAVIYMCIYICANMLHQTKVSLLHFWVGQQSVEATVTRKQAPCSQRDWHAAEKEGGELRDEEWGRYSRAPLCHHTLLSADMTFTPEAGSQSLAFIPATSLARFILPQQSPGSSCHFSHDYL